MPFAASGRMLDLDFTQRRFRRAGMYFAVRLEAGSVAWAVPGLVRTIPTDDTAHMGANGGTEDQPAMVIPVCGNFFSVELQNFSFFRFHIIRRIAVGGAKAIA